MGKRNFRVAAVAAVSVAALAAPALAVHAWSNYHWKKTGAQVTAPIKTAISGPWQSYVNVAVADWNQSSVIESPGPTASGLSAKTCKAPTGEILVCNARYGFTGWLGIAQIWLSDGHIAKGITKLNDSYFNTATYNTPAWRALVTCQEIGHDYGLGHQDEDFDNPDLVSGGTESCMDYTSTPDGNEHPNKHDYDQLELIYNHSDSSFTAVSPGKSGSAVGRAAPLDSAEGGDTPAEWGRAIHYTKDGRPDVYALDLGNGIKKITHVFWALGEGPRGPHHDAH